MREREWQAYNRAYQRENIDVCKGRVREEKKSNNIWFSIGFRVRKGSQRDLNTIESNSVNKVLIAGMSQLQESVADVCYVKENEIEILFCIRLFCGTFYNNFHLVWQNCFLSQRENL